MKRNHNYSRRVLLKNLASAGAIAATGLAWPAFAQRGAAGGAATASGTNLVLLGTQGGPNVSLTRSQTALAIIAGGQPYLVDCGYGTVRALVQAGLRLADVGNVFVSHLHNDHTADLAALLSLKWTGGQSNPQPVNVWGPPGSKSMVEGAVAFFRGDNEIRIIDEGRPVRAETIFKGHDLTAPKVTQVFKDERVTVMAAENAHFPDRAREKMAHRSFAYRFNTPDRSIVISGDTAYSTGLIELARDADVFVCEAMTTAMQAQLQASNRGNAANAESIARHVLETHVSTEEVGRMAAAAKVKTVVLYHLIGGPGQRGGGSPEDAFIPDVKKHFSGEVILGADQMRL
jgi:ribonuclease BN (tRNA processing enzyme)